LALRPITSTPGGGVNENRSAGNLALRDGWVKVNCVTCPSLSARNIDANSPLSKPMRTS
jgi:hypothetical protein